MKTLENYIATVKDGKLTLTADVVDKPVNTLLITRVSHGHINPDHVHHVRKIQSSSEAVFVEAPRGKVAIPNEVAIVIATAIDPNTSFAPVLRQSADIFAVNIVSELPVQIQWQVSDEAFPKPTVSHVPADAAVWADIPGATAATLDKSGVKSKQWIRCVVKNGAGQFVTRPVQVP